MRDINRIPKALRRLEKIWYKAPDMRLGQLMSVLLGTYYRETDQDPFFPEDDIFLSVLEDCFNKKKS